MLTHNYFLNYSFNPHMRILFYILLMLPFGVTSQYKLLELSKTKADTNKIYYVEDSSLYTEKWDSLAQPLFWKKVMVLDQDSCVVNVAKTRKIFFKTAYKDWEKQEDSTKDYVRDSLRKIEGLDSTDRIFVTSGKSHFYQFDKVISSVSRGVELFESFGVDPWYAQTILLIESPGKLDKYSNVGALGPFQLMKGVARKYGLTVNRKVDQRKDFDKSAKAASRLINETCIPMAKAILSNEGITYKENELWFKLFVLHIYHAGAGNVGALLQHHKPEERKQALIQWMWQNEYAKFKNASQNYSQVALASNLIYHQIIMDNYPERYNCSKFGKEI